MGKSLVRALCIIAGLAVMRAPARAADLLPAELRELAAQSAIRSTWPRLRSYAQSTGDAEWNGWALFLAGYQELQAQSYADAAKDLAQAAKSGFALADYAVFNQAVALEKSGRPQDAAAALQDFAARFPHSHLRDAALASCAGDFLEAAKAQQAIDLLTAEPATLDRAESLLLLARAYLQAKRPADAASAYQDIYYRFPASSEAKNAAEQLPLLRAHLGAKFPVVGDELRTARPEALSKAGRCADALKDYNVLLRDKSGNPLAPRWHLGQAECLIRLHRSADALQALFIHFDSPEMEAHRLALLVQVHAQQSDEPGIAQELARLETSYAASPYFADALSSAGIYYYRKLNWQEAANVYRRLGELFPHDAHLRDDGWRLAWCDYLLGDGNAAAVISDYLKAFPDSPRAPAALFWLAHIQEQQGALADAQGLYALLCNRFAHSYYSAEASARLAAIHPKPESALAPNDAPAAPLAAALLPVLARTEIPQGFACLSSAPSDAARPVLILQALGLRNLEVDYLKSALNADNPPPELRLLMAEADSAQGNVAGALFAALRAVPAYAQMDFADLPEDVWDFLYPQPYQKLIEDQARLNNLDPYLVMGLIRQESAYSARAVSPADALGLMQILPETAARSSRPSRTRAAARRLFDPNYNVPVGCAYLAELLKEFDGKPELALAAYNAGDFRVKEWEKEYNFRDGGIFLESIPIPATRTYVELVLRDAAIYRELLSGAPHFATCPQMQSAVPAGAGGEGRGYAASAGPATPRAPQN